MAAHTGTIEKTGGMNDCEKAFGILCQRPDATFRSVTGSIEIRRKIARPGMVSDGTRVFIVRPCERIRWLVVEFGWKTLAEIDQRNFFNQPEAMAEAVMQAIDRACQAYEPGAQGLPQAVIPGAERITDRELAERRMAGAMQPQTRQKPADHGLFDTGARDQLSLF